MERLIQNEKEQIIMPDFKDDLDRSIMTRAYEKSLSILEKESLKPEMFSDTYNSDMLQRHAKYVRRREREIAESRTPDTDWAKAEIFGKTLEAIFHNQLNDGIFGDDVRGVSTTKYDDYHAGVDEVIERYGSNGSTYIGCAIDLTFGKSKASTKVNGVVDDIKNGLLREVAYYESPFGNPPHIHGRLQGIPKVIIGIGEENLIKLSSEWVNDDKDSLYNNHLFLNLLQQIQFQSNAYRDIAKKLNQPEVSQRYDRVYNAISSLYAEQKDIRNVSFLDTSVTNDPVNLSIRETVNGLYANLNK